MVIHSEAKSRRIRLNPSCVTINWEVGFAKRNAIDEQGKFNNSPTRCDVESHRHVQMLELIPSLPVEGV